MTENYIVYVRETNGNITAINSSAFLTDTIGWIQIDEGVGDKYHHAQGNYFDKPIITADGIFRYKLVNGSVVEKTEAEIASEVALIPEPIDENAELAKAITASTTLAQLKSALLGVNGIAKVKADRK